MVEHVCAVCIMLLQLALHFRQQVPCVHEHKSGGCKADRMLDTARLELLEG